MSKVSVIAAVEALEGADLAAADTATCVSLLRDVRRMRGWLDAVEARARTISRPDGQHFPTCRPDITTEHDQQSDHRRRPPDAA